MDDYRLQTEISRRVRHEIAINAEKHRLAGEIEKQKIKIGDLVYSYAKVFTFFSILNLLFSFLVQSAPVFLALPMITFINAAVIIRFYYVLREKRKAFARLNENFVEETFDEPTTE